VPLSVINHIQFADVPDPHEPGTGKSVEITSFGASRNGYAGWIGREYRPTESEKGSLFQKRMPVSISRRVCDVFVPFEPKPEPAVMPLALTHETSPRAKK
jgi:hypothetical protein